MIRKKEPKVIITFHTTAGAIELERSCKAEKIPGRIIPVPRELSAGCGLAWCSPEGEKGQYDLDYRLPGAGRLYQPKRQC